MTVLVTEPSITEEERSIVQWIFSQIGRAMFLEEKHIDVATALCGSGPAFACVVLEAMTDGGVMMGIPRAEAQILVAQSRNKLQMKINGSDAGSSENGARGSTSCDNSKCCGYTRRVYDWWVIDHGGWEDSVNDGSLKDEIVN
jgi:hypothetical protein